MIYDIMQPEEPMPQKTALTLVAEFFGGFGMARAKSNGVAVEPIGERLARLRKERGLTQIELASELGVTQSHISAWERGNLRLHGELIAEIAGLLDVSADELLGLEKVPREDPTSRRLVRRLRSFGQLPKRDQEALLRTIDAFLARAS